MSSRFDPEFYSLYRPFYPAETFAGLEQRLCQRGFIAPFAIADIGCGTGHSTVSLLRSGINAFVIALDPDPEMRQRARLLLADLPVVQIAEGRGEATDLASDSLDAVTIGSAFHWMDVPQTRTEMLRILRPGGVLRIFEYQFPKTDQFPLLNDWIRREFNLCWKAPHQKPRGSLKELTQGIRDDHSFEWLGEGRPAMQATLDVPQLTGLLLSQSRVLHYMDTLEAAERMEFKRSLSETLRGFIGQASAVFDFRLAWVELGRRSL